MLGEILRQSRRSVSLVKHARFSGCSAPAQADELKAAFAERTRPAEGSEEGAREP